MEFVDMSRSGHMPIRSHHMLIVDLLSPRQSMLLSDFDSLQRFKYIDQGYQSPTADVRYDSMY